jgi:hypothetical protein
MSYHSCKLDTSANWLYNRFNIENCLMQVRTPAFSANLDVFLKKE